MECYTRLCKVLPGVTLSDRIIYALLMYHVYGKLK